MSIQEIGSTVKEGFSSIERQDIFAAALIILVGFASFGLGRLSMGTGANEAVVVGAWMATSSELNVSAVENSASKLNTEVSISETDSKSSAKSSVAVQSKSTDGTTAGQGNFVASKNGTKYHFPWCPGAKSISEVNKIYFDTPEAARAAGYTPAANCKGLK